MSDEIVLLFRMVGVFDIMDFEDIDRYFGQVVP